LLSVFMLGLWNCQEAVPPLDPVEERTQTNTPAGAPDPLEDAPDEAPARGWRLVTPGFFWGIWGSGPNDVWAIGGSTYHYDGTAWTEADKHPGARIWGSGPNDVWSVGDSGYCCNKRPIYHFDGTAWSPAYDPMAELDAIWGSGPNDVWATGVSTILHFDGTSWKRDPYGPGFRLSALWGSSSTDVWLFGGAALGAGAGGRYSHFDGGSWTVLSVSDPLARNDALWGSSPRDIWSVGDGLMHWDGLRFTQERGYLGPTRFYGVWGTGPNDVWAVREDGTVLHRDGAGWSSAAFPFPATLRGVWGPEPLGTPGGASELWVVGEQGIYAWRR
jgi:hypothetical protein